MEVLIFFSAVFAYVYSAAVVGKLLYNHYAEPYYRKELKRLRQEELSDYSKAIYKNMTLEEIAWSRATVAVPVEPCILLTIFLPVGLIWLIFLKVGKPHFALPLPKNLAQKDIVARIKTDKKKELENSKKEEWLKVIRAMKEMGIDTTRLEKVEAEYHRAKTSTNRKNN